MKRKNIGVAAISALVLVGCFLGGSSSGQNGKTPVNSDEPPVSTHGTRESSDQKDYQQDLEILNSFRKNRNLEELKKVAEQGSAKWFKRDHQLYFDWVLDVCHVLTSFDFGDDARFVLAEEYAKQALKSREEMPVGVETGLVSCLTHDVDYVAGKMSDREWAERRKEKADLWLHAMNRLEKSIDETFDPDDKRNWPVTNVMPPIGDGKQILTAGMNADEVQDPQVRAQYKALIEVNRKKAEKLNDQVTFRGVQRYFFKIGEKYLVTIYSRKPYATKELQVFLQLYPVNQKREIAIVDKIKKNTGF